MYIRIDGDDDELEKLRDTLKANEANIKGDIETKPWGLRDLIVEDPDGVSAVPRFPDNKVWKFRSCVADCGLECHHLQSEGQELPDAFKHYF